MKKKVYTPGMEDIERLLDNLKSEERKARSIEYLRKRNLENKSKPKGGDTDEDNSRHKH